MRKDQLASRFIGVVTELHNGVRAGMSEDQKSAKLNELADIVDDFRNPANGHVVLNDDGSYTIQSLDIELLNGTDASTKEELEAIGGILLNRIERIGQRLESYHPSHLDSDTHAAAMTTAAVQIALANVAIEAALNAMEEGWCEA